MGISTRRRRACPATCTGCRSRRRSACPLAGLPTTGSYCLRSIRLASPSSASARSTLAERAFLRESDIRVFTMSDIDRVGIEHAMREALDRVAGPGFVHVSLDLDSLDPGVAPGVGTPVRGGLTYREAHLACELVAESGIAGSFEVVESEPILDRENTTALTAVELIASALGQTIL